MFAAVTWHDNFARRPANVISFHLQTVSSSDTDSDSNHSESPAKTYDFWNHHKVLAHSKQKKGSIRQNLKQDELALYLSNPIATLNGDVFNLWEEMKTVYPNLYKLARKYLLIPATSVPAERLFSKAGITMSKTRNRLLGKRMEKILFMSDCNEDEWVLK